MFYTTICAIAKDENPHLKEWVLYHLAVGFEHIIIYDNNSKVPISQELADYVSAGLVTVIDWPLTRAQQLSAYVDCHKRVRESTFWLAYIDLDEFIVPMRHRDVRDLLDDYRQYGGLGMHWMMFGASGHISRPQGGMMENYTGALGLNPHIKSIVQPRAIVRPASVHHCLFQHGQCCVNEDGVVIHSFCSFPVGRKIRVNHYYYRSQQDFEEKIARGVATQMVSGADRDMGLFYDHLALPETEDTTIQAWLPLVRKFANLPAAALARVVTEPVDGDLATGIADISAHLGRGDIARARHGLTLLSRHQRSPHLAIVEASLAFWEDNEALGLDILSRALREYADDRQAVAQLFEEVARHYERTGQGDTARLVREFGCSQPGT